MSDIADIEISLTETKDGFKVDGLAEGIARIHDDYMPRLIHMSITGELFPFFIFAAMVDIGEPVSWLVVISRGDSKVEGDPENGELQL